MSIILNGLELHGPSLAKSCEGSLGLNLACLDVWAAKGPPTRPVQVNGSTGIRRDPSAYHACYMILYLNLLFRRFWWIK